MLCVIDHKSPCKQACPYHYREGGCFWEDARRAGKPYYWTCPKCGASLDPGETCDCMKKKPLPALPTPGTATNKKLIFIVRKSEGKVNARKKNFRCR